MQHLLSDAWLCSATGSLLDKIQKVRVNPANGMRSINPYSLERKEASKSARADVAVSMGDPTVFPFVTLFIL